MSYSEYLKNNPYWERVKTEIKNRDNNQCQICGNITDLEVHHITYKVNGKSIVGNELNYLHWLIALCKKHHKEVHESRNHLLNPKGYFKIHALDFKKLINRN